MPYKRKKDQKEYQRRYSSFRARRDAALRKAIMKGDFDLAQRILKRKPNIHLRPTPKKRKRKAKKRRRR